MIATLPTGFWGNLIAKNKPLGYPLPRETRFCVTGPNPRDSIWIVMSQDDLVLLGAAYLHVPSRRLRALARAQDRDLKEWIAGDSSRKVSHARHQAREAV